MNVFERLSIFDMHVAIDVGGPLIPDLVGSSFRNLEIHDVDVGLRFFVRLQSRIAQLSIAPVHRHLILTRC